MRRIIYSLILILIFTSLLSISVYSRTYYFDEVNITATVDEQGYMQIEEKRKTTFEGQFNGLYIWIPKDNNLKIHDVTVSDQQKEYSLYTGTEEYGPAGTFVFREEANRYLIDWSIDVRDKTETYTISYTVENALLVHDDIAEIYYQFIGDGWEVETKKVQVELRLPPGNDEIRAWGHGPLSGVVEIKDQNTVLFKVSPLPAKTFLEGRIIFDPARVSNATNFTNKMMLDEILEQEARLARRANIRRRIAQAEMVLAAIVFFSASILSATLWKKFGRRASTDFEGEYLRELPQNYSPAELGVLLKNGRPGVNDFTATILDLARRGYLTIEEVEVQRKGLFRSQSAKEYIINNKNKEGDLAEHEKQVLDLLFNVIKTEKADQVSFKSIIDYSKNNKTQFRSFWKKWEKNLTYQGKEVLKFFDQKARQAQALWLGIAVLLAGLGFVFLLFLELYWVGMAALVSGLILGISSATFRQRSSRGENDYVRWRAFRRFLEHFSTMDRQKIPALVVWEHFLVYAVTLNVATQVIKKLEQLYPNLESEGYRFGHAWLYGSALQTTQGIGSSINSLSQGINQTFSQAFSQSSSAGGSGGGFSGGGGGGSGGGGGGAR